MKIIHRCSFNLLLKHLNFLRMNKSYSNRFTHKNVRPLCLHIIEISMRISYYLRPIQTPNTDDNKCIIGRINCFLCILGVSDLYVYTSHNYDLWRHSCGWLRMCNTILHACVGNVHCDLNNIWNKIIIVRTRALWWW